MNYTFRMHDPRIGRFFAVDPLARSYPWNSPYAFSENSTIAFGELGGLEKAWRINPNPTNRPVFREEKNVTVEKRFQNAVNNLISFIGNNTGVAFVNLTADVSEVITGEKIGQYFDKYLY